MCDPITMSAMSAGMSYLGGSTMLAGTTMGTGLINAASFINYGSTYGKLGGALSAGAAGLGTSVTAAAVKYGGKAMDSIGVGNVISAGGQLYGDYQTRKYAGMQTQLAIQHQEFQEKEFKRQRELEELDAKQEELDRRNVYYANLKKNRVYAAKYGYTTTSPSYRAFLESNRETAMMDSYFTRLLGREKSLSTTQQIDQTHVARKGLTEGYKTQTKASVTDTLLKTYDALTT